MQRMVYIFQDMVSVILELVALQCCNVTYRKYSGKNCTTFCRNVLFCCEHFGKEAAMCGQSILYCNAEHALQASKCFFGSRIIFFFSFSLRPRALGFFVVGLND